MKKNTVHALLNNIQNNLQLDGFVQKTINLLADLQKITFFIYIYGVGSNITVGSICLKNHCVRFFL
jgi:hypothetical protein